jgi:hypothetical protein
MAIEQLRRLGDGKEVSFDFLLVDPFEGAVRAALYFVPSSLDDIPRAAE